MVRMKKKSSGQRRREDWREDFLVWLRPELGGVEGRGDGE